MMSAPCISPRQTPIMGNGPREILRQTPRVGGSIAHKAPAPRVLIHSLWAVLTEEFGSRRCLHDPRRTDGRLQGGAQHIERTDKLGAAARGAEGDPDGVLGCIVDAEAVAGHHGEPLPLHVSG